MPKKPPAFVIKWKNSIADELQRRGYEKPASKLRDCSERELLLCCDNCGHNKFVTFLCSNRICPICAWRLSKERAEYSEAMLGQMEYAKFLTLTMPRWKDDPTDGIKYIRSCFSKLRSRKVWKGVRGGCYQIELKQKQDGWNIHIHILLDSPFLPKQKLFTAWKDILGLEYASIDIKACRTKEQRKYVVKYVSKDEDFKGNTKLAVDWYEAVLGSRLYGTFGRWYNAKIEELLNRADHEVYVPQCENCGAVRSMFYARDGPFIFGKDWLNVRISFCGCNEDSRVKVWADECNTGELNFNPVNAQEVLPYKHQVSGDGMYEAFFTNWKD